MRSIEIDRSRAGIPKNASDSHPLWKTKLALATTLCGLLILATVYSLLAHSGAYFNQGEVTHLEFVVLACVLPLMGVPLVLAVRRGLRPPHASGWVMATAALDLLVLVVGSVILYGLPVY